MRDLSKPLASTYGDPVKRANRRNDRKLKKAERKNVVGAVSRKEQREKNPKRVQIKTPTYEEGSGKRLSMAKRTVVGDRKGNIKKTRGVQKSGGMKSVSKTNYKTGKEVSRTRKTVGAKIRTAARKAGVGQNKGQRSMSTAKTGLGENGYPIRK